MELGGYTGEGFQIGIDSMIKKVKQSAGEMASAALPNVSMAYGVPSGAVSGVQAAFAADGQTGGSQTVNFERMFEGATFTVRNDSDVKAIARELHTLTESAKRKKGIR
jgi:hypothetical protein